jgi:ring-1,2-phenylacetyl-CoA epoxidase subunit PaaC
VGEANEDWSEPAVSARAESPEPSISDNPYDWLADVHSDDHRWAYGTGFTDPLAGVDTSVPEGVDADALAAYCIALGDDALIYSHRLQQWITRLPELEEETAVANVALDLLGQARMLLSRAGQIVGRTEDELAFFRTEPEFRNVRLVERLDGDFAELVGRLLVFASWRLAVFERLASFADPVLAAIAAKGVNELTYHRDYAAQWVVRLGDGTDVSKRRMQAALGAVWPYLEELFVPHPGELVAVARGEVDVVLDTVLATAGLDRPDVPALASVSGRAGRDGVHTEALGYLLAELQSVARAHPDATW